MEETITEFLNEKPGYLKKSNQYLLEKLELYPITKKKLKICGTIKKVLRSQAEVKVKKPDYKSYTKFNKVPTKPKERSRRHTRESFDPNNILIIGDLHEPFCLEGYLEHCLETQKKYNCGTVIFIGDVIDNHYASYHETDPDGFGAGEELDRAIHKLATWYREFPEATVLIGNHDRLIYRKAYTAGLSKRWIRDLNEVLNTANWDFVEEITINGVNYSHGEGGTAKTRMKNEMQSQVQGHLHSQFYIEYSVSPNAMLFGVQVGCGIDRKAYAMAYGKNYKKPIIGCAVMINDQPLLVPMVLEDN